MRSTFQATIVAAFISFGSAAVASQSASPQAPAKLETGSILYGVITKTVDAKKVKVGDPISAVLAADVLAHGKVVARHDSKLVGHVTEVQVHTKEQPESRLGIVFDKVITKAGELPFQSLLLAIRPGEHPTVELPPARSPMATSAQGPYPAPEGSSVSHRIDPKINDATRHRDRPVESSSLSDIEGLSLTSSASGGAQAIVSTQRTVKLESGVKIELRVTGQ
jgi:hypothetical protein